MFPLLSFISYLCGANLVQVKLSRMEKFKPSVSLFYDTRSKKKLGKSPLKLTIYCRPYKKRYKTNIDLTEDEWTKVNSERLRDDSLKTTKIKIQALVTRAEKCLENLTPFSFGQFEKMFFKNATNLDSLNLSTLFTNYISILDRNGNVGTAISYKTSLNSFDEFKKNLTLPDITVAFLQEYEASMLLRGKSPSTVGIYVRQLRAIYNDAVARSLISIDNYPFGKNKYIIPASRNVKKALSMEDINKILNCSPNTEDGQRALDFWVLSYLCSGINFCDIAQLKHEDIKGNFIYYIRSKTKNTKKSNQQFVKVPLHPRARIIIDKWACKNPDAGFVFPVLNDQLSPRQVKYKIQGFIKATNEQMEIIRKDLGITQKCNTYSCRHSFATVLKRKNVSTEFISESLGHSSLLTTSAYLDSFEDRTKVEYSNLLTSF